MSRPRIGFPGQVANPGRPRVGADFLVGIDVRIPHAGAGDALARQAACSIKPTSQVVRRQIEYGMRTARSMGSLGIGVQRSRLDLTYQYSSFGVPGPGLKRGLSEDMVIAPYATALAAMIDPSAATQNFARIAEAGGKGAYGYYEAIDYTGQPGPEGKD